MPALPTIGWKSASNDATIASYRFRVAMPAAGLSDLGFRAGPVEEIGIDQCDVVVFSKSYSLSDLALARSVKKRGGRVFFDLCDNHFYNPSNLRKYEEARVRILEMMSIADGTICTTDALARTIAEESGGTVNAMVVGDAAERLKFRRKPVPLDDRRLDLLWFGSHGSPNAPGGMEDLGLIQAELTALAQERAIRLTVCSNNEAKFRAVTEAMRFETRYLEWSPESYARAMKGAHAVVIPITRNPFTESKSHNRLTSALYAGLPVVATGIESYREFAEFCVLDDWSGGFEGLATDLPGRTAQAWASRPYIDRHWAMKALTRRWIKALELPAHTARRRRQTSPGVAETPNYQGRLDPVAAGAVTGWVRNLRRPEEPVIVDLEVDGERVASAVADIPRPDLVAVGIGPGNCGFSLASHEIGSGGRKRVTVRARPHGWLVGEDPIFTQWEVSSATSEEHPAADLHRRQRSPAVRAVMNSQADILKDSRRLQALFAETRTLLMKSLIAGGDSLEQLTAVQGVMNPANGEAPRPTGRAAKAGRAAVAPPPNAGQSGGATAKSMQSPDGGGIRVPPRRRVDRSKVERSGE